MGIYGLLNSQWALILAMVTIAAPYAIWVLKQASDKLPVELDEAAHRGRRVAAAACSGSSTSR
jgi:multiple sugar transport system permease protein